MNKDAKLVMTLGQLMQVLCDTTSSDIICRGCPLEQEYPGKCSDLSDEEVLKTLSKYGITHLFSELPNIYVSDANISHILPTLNAEINRLKEENKHLRKNADKVKNDFEALTKHTAILTNRVDEYDKRLRETMAIVPKPSPGYRVCFERINVSSVYKNSDGTYNIWLWGNAVESLRDKIDFLEQNNKAYSELCMSLQKITDRKEIPNERAYTEHDAD